MTMFTINDLAAALEAAAGPADEAIDTGTLDTAFEELGYDSLALLETVSVLERDYGVKLTDDTAKAKTPQAFLDALNAQAATGTSS